MKRIPFILCAVITELTILAFYGTSQGEVSEAREESVTCSAPAVDLSVADDAKVERSSPTRCDAVEEPVAAGQR